VKKTKHLYLFQTSSPPPETSSELTALPYIIYVCDVTLDA